MVWEGLGKISCILVMCMKGVVLAGGRGTRLLPLTKNKNKHLLPLGKEPMIFNPVKQMIYSGIKEIMVITGEDAIDEMRGLLIKYMGSVCRFSFVVQPAAGGIAEALLLSEEFSNNEPLLVILGDNIAAHSIKPYVDKYRKRRAGAMLLLKDVDDPKRYGIAGFCDGKLANIVEKPVSPESSFAVTGIYMYDHNVFQYIRETKPANGGEWGITPVNLRYLQAGRLAYEKLRGFWIDAGTVESYHYAHEMLLRIENKIICGDEYEDTLQ